MLNSEHNFGGFSESDKDGTEINCDGVKNKYHVGGKNKNSNEQVEENTVQNDEKDEESDGATDDSDSDDSDSEQDGDED